MADNDPPEWTPEDYDKEIIEADRWVLDAGDVLGWLARVGGGDDEGSRESGPRALRRTVQGRRSGT